MAKPKTWQDIGNVKARQAARAQQLAKDAAYRAAHSTATVKDGQTIADLADQTGVAPADILAANPELKNIKTGMVLNIPQGSVYQGHGIGGLPSNAALGGTTTNPYGGSGNTPYGPPKPFTPVGMGGFTGTSVVGGSNNQFNPVGMGGYQGMATSGYTGFNPAGTNPFPMYQQTGTQPPLPFAGTNVASINTYQAPASAMNTAPIKNATYPGKPYQYNTSAYQEPLIKTQNYLSDVALKLNTLGESSIDDNQKRWLILAGLAQDVPASGSGSGGGYRRRRGGGGGGGSAGTARTTQQSTPAFSSGSGGFSLVNWRI